jgi:hypothetical protein
LGAIPPRSGPFTNLRHAKTLVVALEGKLNGTWLFQRKPITGGFKLRFTDFLHLLKQSIGALIGQSDSND